jgi:hypothetical protein
MAEYSASKEAVKRCLYSSDKYQIVCLRCRGNKVIRNFNLSIFSVVQTLVGDELIRIYDFQTFQKTLHLGTNLFISEIKG